MVGESRLSVIWNPSRKRLAGLADPESYDHFVLDIDSPLENTVQTIVQNTPDLILIPVNLQAGALTKLADPLAVIAQLEEKAGRPLKVRIVPLGAKLADIRRELERIQPSIRDCQVAPRVRDLHRQSNIARRDRYYIWQHPDCSDLEAYYQALIQG